MLKSFLSVIFTILFCLSLPAQNSGEQHWEQIPGFIDGSIDVIEVKENDLIIGGPFYSIDFDSNAANIAKWNGSGWETFGTGLNGWCTSIAFIVMICMQPVHLQKQEMNLLQRLLPDGMELNGTLSAGA